MLHPLYVLRKILLAFFSFAIHHAHFSNRIHQNPNFFGHYMISHRPTLPIHEHAWLLTNSYQRRTENRRSKGGILFRHSWDVLCWYNCVRSKVIRDVFFLFVQFFFDYFDSSFFLHHFSLGEKFREWLSTFCLSQSPIGILSLH